MILGAISKLLTEKEIGTEHKNSVPFFAGVLTTCHGVV